MSLSAAQRAILRDMASGAELRAYPTEIGALLLLRVPGMGWDRLGYYDAIELCRTGLLEQTPGTDEHGNTCTVYALTPAGAAAAGEGAI